MGAREQHPEIEKWLVAHTCQKDKPDAYETECERVQLAV